MSSHRHRMACMLYIDAHHHIYACVCASITIYITSTYMMYVYAMHNKIGSLDNDDDDDDDAGVAKTS